MRTYQLHVPGAGPMDRMESQVRGNTGKGSPATVQTPRRPAPLVIVLHGSGADGAGMERFSKFSPLADHEGFIVVYPDALQHEWNDGREVAAIPSQAGKVDDVAFVDTMISRISATHRIDPRRIYATGFSNGGIFAHYLGSKLAGRLAAIAPVSGGLAEPALRQFHPSAPLSVCMIHGEADHQVPFGGGEVDEHDNGRIIATEESANLWTQHAGSFATPTSALLSDTTPIDHRRVRFTRWAGPSDGTEVVLYTIEDGGHAWPSEPEVRRVHRILRTSRSFDATTAIWEFFKRHPKV